MTRRDLTLGRGDAASGLVRHDLAALVCRVAVGVVFVYASIDKILHPEAFAQAIANYRMTPAILLHPFAWLLPVVEAVAGIALLLGLLRRGAALLCAAMTVMFIVAIAVAMARGLDISCGCFETEGGGGVGLSLLIRDVFLLAGAVVPLLARRDRWSLDHALGRENRR